MEFLQENWADIGGIAALVIVLGERIAAYTETKKDDAFFGFVHKILETLKIKFPE